MTAKLPQPARTLSVNETAQYLAENLGSTKAHWASWLANERKPGRVNRKLPVRPGIGRPKYDADIVEAFVIDKKTEDESRGVSHVSAKDREFIPHIYAVTASENDGVPLVLLVTIFPLASYKLTATKAREIARRLNTAAESAEEDA